MTSTRSPVGRSAEHTSWDEQWRTKPRPPNSYKPPRRMKRGFKVLALVLVLAGLALLVIPIREQEAPAGPNDASTRPQDALTADLDGSVPPALRSGFDTYSATVEPESIEVFTRPSDSSEVRLTLPKITEHGQAQTLLVLDGVRAGRQDWYKVLLPIRPNGATGWMQGNDVRIDPITYKVDVHLADHMIRVYKSDELLREIPVGVGTVDTPTPGGRFYLMELLEPPDPNTAYGRYTYVLNGYSNVHKEFNGGPGLIGIHGTNRPDLIGQDVSNGCVRMTNENIEWLVPKLPLGTPVQIYG